MGRGERRADEVGTGSRIGHSGAFVRVLTGAIEATVWQDTVVTPIECVQQHQVAQRSECRVTDPASDRELAFTSEQSTEPLGDRSLQLEAALVIAQALRP